MSMCQIRCRNNENRNEQPVKLKNKSQNYFQNILSFEEKILKSSITQISSTHTWPLQWVPYQVVTQVIINSLFS